MNWTASRASPLTGTPRASTKLGAIHIVLAERHGGAFAADDNAAYQFATRRPGLGHSRVIDTVEILRSAIAQDIITAQDAVDIADDIATADRWLRSMHDGHIRIAYFEPDF